MNLIFAEIEQILEDHKLAIDPAYFHGMLAGLICAGVEDDDIDDWLPALFSNRFMAQDDYQKFSDNVLGAFHSVQTELNQDGFGFQILLPDDEASLEHRVGMMGSWCRGYLVALVDYAETAIEALPNDCAEFVDDLTGISDIEIDDDEPQDTLDESFMLLEEHIRVGVQLVYEHMNPLQPN